MKTVVSHSIVKCALVLAFGCWGAYADTQTNAAAKFAPAIVKSVFVADAQAGKDPFFPNSTRGRVVVPEIITTNVTPQPSVALEKLLLKGISGPIGQRLALINSSTVGIGEYAEIRLGGQQTVKIRCLEIRDNSVLIALDATGETKELKLRDGA
jgi:hypothetical protein